MKVVITVEVEDQEQARLLAKGLQYENMRKLVMMEAKLIEMGIDPDDPDRNDIIKMAREIRYGKGRH